jgi:hypothetical protein
MPFEDVLNIDNVIFRYICDINKLSYYVFKQSTLAKCKISVTFTGGVAALQTRHATVLSFPILCTVTVVICLCVKTWSIIITWIWTTVIMVHLKDGKNTYFLLETSK